MDLGKTTIFGIHLTEHEQLKPPFHLIAQIVLIDDTNEAVPSVLYELSKKPIESTADLKQIDPHLHDSFILLGEIEKIDKKTKIISLRNKNTISYEYLIIASDPKQGNFPLSEEDFQAGLNALYNALKVTIKMPVEEAQMKKTLEKKRLILKPEATDISFLHCDKLMKSLITKDLEIAKKRLFHIRT